jgi:hypothetical protein
MMIGNLRPRSSWGWNRRCGVGEGRDWMADEIRTRYMNENGDRHSRRSQVFFPFLTNFNGRRR